MLNRILKIGILLIVPLIFGSCLQYKLTMQNRFNLSFGSCLKHDTIDLFINDSLILNNLNVNTGDDGVVPNIFINYSGNMLNVEVDNNVDQIEMNIKRLFKITLRRNSNVPKDIVVKLNKGRNILIHGCLGDDAVYINQYKKVIQLD